MKKLNKELSSLLADCDNIDIAEVLSEIKMKKKLSEIQKQYKDKIKIRGDDCRLYVRIKDKQFFGNTAEEVFEKIYQHQYGLTTYSIYELFPLYLDYREQYTAVKSLTLKKYVNDFDKYFKPYKEILDKPFALLGVKDYIRLFNRWTAKLDMTAKTFNNLKSIINGMYSFTITELDFDITNKVRDIDMRQFQVKPVKPVDKAFTFEEREMILKYLSNKSDAYSLALAFNFYCGMRLGELLALKHSDVADGKVSINGQLIKDVDIKTNQVNYVTSDFIKGYTEQGYRSLPLKQDAIDILKKAKRSNPFGEYIFMQDGKQLNPDTYNSRLRRLCKKLGLKPRSSHSVRFTYASLLYLNGVSSLNISRLLGHTSVTMTNRYINNIMPHEELDELVKQAL